MKAPLEHEREPWWNLEGTVKEDRGAMLQDWQALERRIARKPAPANWIRSAAAVILIILSGSLIWLQTNNLKTAYCFFAAEKTVTLPDGSEVELTRGAVLRYPASLGSDGTRQVSLNGQAAFQVSADPVNPFIVDTGEAKVKVTGTSFIISARSNREIEVLVQSGKVLFYNSEIPGPDAFRVGLSAGDMGVYLPRLGQLNKKQFLSTP